MARRGVIVACTLATALAAACAARPAATAAAKGDGRNVRVALNPNATRVKLGGGGVWRLQTRGESTLLRASATEVVTVEAQDGRVRGVTPAGVVTRWSDGPVSAVAGEGGHVAVDGRQYRGTIVITPKSNGAMLVYNVLPMEQYLRGVVPQEIGPRTDAEFAAVAAQAIAARTYAYAKLRLTASRPYDFAATVDDQVYGGVNAERPVADRAVRETRGRVLRYKGRLAEAPYSAVCGGSTAAQPEVWTHKGEEPYLRPVNDRIPGTDRFYCDIAGRFKWTRQYGASELVTVLERYLRDYAPVTTGSVGYPQLFAVEERTASNRVAKLAIVTDRGRYVLRGNAIRFVLRTSGGEILNSTYFSVESEVGRDGRLSRLTLTGRGNGHGIGMCQWGAIGRARAGQDYRTILRTYYPGTEIGQVD